MIEKTLIGATEFHFISVIIPKADSQGQIIEESPALKYHNVKELPLNKYGDGPFCRFKIPTDPDVSGTLV